MQSQEFVDAWKVRRGRQILISVAACAFILAFAVSVGTADMSKPPQLWQKIVVFGIPIGIIGLIVASIYNARCPNCGALKGSGIFFAPSCSKCNMP